MRNIQAVTLHGDLGVAQRVFKGAPSRRNCFFYGILGAGIAAEILGIVKAGFVIDASLNVSDSFGCLLMMMMAGVGLSLEVMIIVVVNVVVVVRYRASLGKSPLEVVQKKKSLDFCIQVPNLL